ncbi:MAG TPA: copper resistance protein CopC [Gemmatimonadaceae bacterium]|jgi:copper transport protein|nr:copper resistance protein CopC [Gemmatimonadaceae bacterium]
MQHNKVIRGVSLSRLVSRASALAIVAVLVLPIAVWAHAHLRRSDPSARARVTTPPTAIRLWFTERPELGFTRVQLRAGDTTEIALGAATRLSDDPMGVAIAIPRALTPGSYTVLWRTAAADGHATSGSFTFEVVGAVPAVAVDSSRPPISGHALVRVDSTTEQLPSINVSAATRWLEFMAMLAVIGGVVFQLIVLPRAERAMAGALPAETRLEIAASTRKLAQSALILLAITALSRLYGEASAVLGPDRPINRATLGTILGTSWGRGWLVGIVGILVTAAGIILVRRVNAGAGWLVAALGALAIGGSPALTGHASATDPVALAIAADVGHVCAACAWVGTLLTVLFAAMPLVRAERSMEVIGSGPLVASLVRAFHPVALACAAIVVVSGLISAWLRLPTVASLGSSMYGRVLLLKLAFVAIVLVLGFRNWRRVLPTLGDDAAARRITRTAGAELTAAALVLAVTAVLVSTSPPEVAERGARGVERASSPPSTPGP